MMLFTVIKTANNIKIVCNMSVQMMVFIPPRLVYSQIKATVTITEETKDIFNPMGSKTAI